MPRAIYTLPQKMMNADEPKCKSAADFAMRHELRMMAMTGAAQKGHRDAKAHAALIKWMLERLMPASNGHQPPAKPPR